MADDNRRLLWLLVLCSAIATMWIVIWGVGRSRRTAAPAPSEPITAPRPAFWCSGGRCYRNLDECRTTEEQSFKNGHDRDRCESATSAACADSPTGETCWSEWDDCRTGRPRGATGCEMRQ